MRKTTVRPVQVVHPQRTVITEIVCDFCGKTSRGEGCERYPGGVDWSTEGFSHIDQITVMRQTGTNYPEGSWGTNFIIDCCPQCWDTKLWPMALEHGQPTEEEYD